jgi:hypothetical protein
MTAQIQPPRHTDIQKWSLDDWNDALYSHFFVSAQNELAAPVVTLNVTNKDLRDATGRECTEPAARVAFIDAIKKGMGRRSLAGDASHRAAHWNSNLDTVPPFLSHLLLTCMVANDLAEELQWTDNFRVRLSQILDTQSQPQLERLRSLWENLAAWSVRQNLAGARCRQLRLPHIPDTGYHSIIGYSVRLAVPSRRDQSMLATLLRRNGLDGREPEINAVLNLVNTNIARFGDAFRGVFEDFVTAYRRKKFALLAQTAFWTAVRAVALAGLQTSGTERTGLRVRLELEDDDGNFWLTLTSEMEFRNNYARSLPVPTPRQSPYRFLLTDLTGGTLTDILFSSQRADTQTESALVNIRSAVAEGLLLFEEADDYVFVMSTTFPSTGRLRALVSDRLKASLKLALDSTDTVADVRKSKFPGWSEWRGLTADGLRAADVSRFPSLQAVRALRLTIPPPEIKLRGGIRHGSSFIAMSGVLPAIQVSDADQVNVELTAGEWQPLVRESEPGDRWHFKPDLPAGRLFGRHRIVAFASSVPIAERVVSFIEMALGHDYKLPTEPERWLVESTCIDMVSVAAATNCVHPVAAGPTTCRSPRDLVLDAESPMPSSSSPLVALTTLLCSRFSAQRGLSEGELVEILKGELGIKTAQVWPVLRGWLEGGMLDALTDARWRARIYFGRVPQLTVYRGRGFQEAALTGLVPPYLRERFDALTAELRLSSIERRSVSPFVPTLPRCRSNRLALLDELARELNLPGIAQVREAEELLMDIRTAATILSSTTSDSWPFFRKWDWSRLGFSERPAAESVSGISLDWCRRDDGPDRYKVYKDGSLLWWTRSRTWAVLAASTLADVPVFTLESDGAMHSRGDSLYLPLPAARAVVWSGPGNSGPVTLPDGHTAYRYTFHDDRARDSVLAKMWPQEFRVDRPISDLTTAVLSTALRTAVGPHIPVPVGLKVALDRICDGSELHVPSVVPLSALPRLYALVATCRRGEL